jgi:hypothetical protein
MTNPMKDLSVNIQEQVRQILQAEAGLGARAAYAELLNRAGPQDIRKLRLQPNDSLAVRAA